MRNSQHDHYDRNKGSHLVLQTLGSHAIQELITAINAFFRHQARAKKTEARTAGTSVKINFSSTARANNVETREDTGAMKRVVVTKNRNQTAIIMVQSMIPLSGPIH